MKLNTKFIISKEYDPFRNQGLEKHLLDVVEDDGIILYLWQNAHTVVIGKNQNAWQECKLRELEEAGGRLARRISGGGAVYHDLGNLNFTFVVKEQHYSIPRQQKVICNALNRLGIRAEITGRNDIHVDGKKISGNAFYEGHSCFHHGTLMISVDTAELGRFLNPSAAKLKSKGVASVRSRVANLNTFYPGLTPELLTEHLIAAFGEEYGTTPTELTPDMLDAAALEQERAFFRDEEWRLMRPIPCDLTVGDRFDWGEIQIRIRANRGVVSEVQVFTDSLEPGLAEGMEQALLGEPFASEALGNALLHKGFPKEAANLLISEHF